MNTLLGSTPPSVAAGPEPRTLAILESSAKMGGIQHTTLALAARLDRRLWSPVLICPEEGELTDACRLANIEVRTLPVLPMWSTSFWVGNQVKLPNPFAWLWNVGTILASAGRVGHFLRGLKPDLVLTKGLLCHFYGGLAARREHIPCLWYVQDQISERSGGIYKGVFGMMARVVPAGIAVIGPQIVRQLPASIRHRVQVVYNAIDPAKFRKTGNGKRVRAELGISPQEMVLGNAARLTPWKGQHHLVEAFGQIAARVPDVKLLLVGGSLFGDESYEHRVRAQVEALGLGERVIFAGHRQDMHDVFSAMDVFAYCSTEKDICPLSLLEAMSAGLPIAAFDIDGVCEAMRGEEDGLLVRSADTHALAESLLRLLTNRDLCVQLGESARARIERDFSLDRHVTQMEQVFESLLVRA